MEQATSDAHEQAQQTFILVSQLLLKLQSVLAIDFIKLLSACKMQSMVLMTFSLELLRQHRHPPPSITLARPIS
jgi:hypothetical protein